MFGGSCAPLKSDGHPAERSWKLTSRPWATRHILLPHHAVCLGPQQFLHFRLAHLSPWVFLKPNFHSVLSKNSISSSIASIYYVITEDFSLPHWARSFFSASLYIGLHCLAIFTLFGYAWRICLPPLWFIFWSRSPHPVFWGGKTQGVCCLLKYHPAIFMSSVWIHTHSFTARWVQVP